jgi:membrane protease YdiL (CAAX protease family)
MTTVAAVGWAFGVTFAFILLRNVTLALRPGSTYDLVTELGCQAIAYLLGLFLIMRVHAPEASIRDTIGLRSTHFVFYPLAILLGVAIELPADGLYEAIVRRYPTGIEDRFVEIYREASIPQRAMYALLLVVVGPALEEVLFRGAIFRLLSRTTAVRSVMVTTAVLFAIVHLQWQMFVPIGLVGLALALIRHASGSIVPSLLVHGSFNAVSFVLMGRSAPSSNGPTFPPTIVAAAAGAALVLLGLAHLVGARSATAARAQEMDRR